MKILERMMDDYQEIIINDGVQQLKRLTEMLNTIIEEDGEVKKNNSILWGDFLHKYSNEDWAKMVIVLDLLAREHPGLLKSNEEMAFAQAQLTLDKYWSKYDRVLDKSQFKTYAWKLMMSALDFVNRINNRNPYANTTNIGKLFYVES